MLILPWERFGIEEAPHASGAKGKHDALVKPHSNLGRQLLPLKLNLISRPVPVISLPLTSPLWVDHRSLEGVPGPSLPSDLTGNWELALAAMDNGLLRLRLVGERLIVETTKDPRGVLADLRILFVSVPSVCTYVRVVNLRTSAVTEVSLRNLLDPPRPSTLAHSLKKKPLFDYVFPDICDAATTREQHHAVYGSRLRLDWDRLNLATATKTLTFSNPAGFPHIRMASRHPVLGLRDVYLVVGLQQHEIYPSVEDKFPVAWAHPWEGLVWVEGVPRSFDFKDAEEVAGVFGEFDLAAVNRILVVAAQAHGWNQLPFPRSWEGATTQLRLNYS